LPSLLQTPEKEALPGHSQNKQERKKMDVCKPTKNTKKFIGKQGNAFRFLQNKENARGTTFIMRLTHYTQKKIAQFINFLQTPFIPIL
jgi:hypothetical protein